ncbi:MAG: two-component sensor histidine kinase [Stappia sp.]|uniref:sensor histidine kinase n=1 Tax=Stappia sp. TaxID=1870903 RepID=UPI000C45778A|nr:HAMP domain-containing sensor histidine kinase [Stappia sp.]MAA99915.1 two-component sensor histidine kinase [Stappia sp.]MBM20957.1 two-component sensor histidine kinase [Stappia sp.]
MASDETRNGDARTASNSERAQRRRDVAKTVRSARERLASVDGVQPNFEYDLLLTFTKNRLSAAIALPLFSMIVAGISLLWMQPAVIAGWLAFSLIAHVLLMMACRRFEREAAGSQTLASWRRQMIAGDLLYGLTWAGFFLLQSTTTNQDGSEIFQFATMLIVIAMLTMLSSSLPRALLAGTLPITIAIVVSFLNQQTAIHYAMMAMAIGAQGFFVMLGNQLHASTLTMLAFRAEKDHLISELEQAKAISDEARRRAEEANLAKSRFLATMSHELRTPLNAILGFSEVMKNELLGPLENPTYRDYAGDIHSSGEHLLNLINEILDLSRIEAGRYELSEEAVDLAAILGDCHSMMQIRANKKTITISEAIEKELPRIWADERAVRQVLLNLLSNAVKFTPTGGEVLIKAGWTAGGGQYVSIRDNGPGIPEDEIPIVMQAFGQGAIAIKSAEAGTGLGLPIVKALVQMHGGTFDLKSRLREGTEVLVTFPASRVLEAMPALDEAPTAAEPKRRRAAARLLRKAS